MIARSQDHCLELTLVVSRGKVRLLRVLEASEKKKKEKEKNMKKKMMKNMKIERKEEMKR